MANLSLPSGSLIGGPVLTLGNSQSLEVSRGKVVTKIYVWFSDLPTPAGPARIYVAEVSFDYEYKLLPEQLPVIPGEGIRIQIVQAQQIAGTPIVGDMAPVMELDQYNNLSYTKIWQDVGKFSFEVSAGTEQGQRLKTLGIIPTVGEYCVMILVDGQHDFVGFIDDCRIEMDNKGIVTYKLSGNDLSRLLADRIVLPPSASETDSFNGPAEDIMRSLVDRNLINPIASGIGGSNDDQRQVGLLQTTNHHYGNTVHFEGRFQNLLSAIQELAQGSDLGFDFQVTDRQLYFEVDAGRDNHASIKLGPDLDNVSSFSWEKNALNFASHVYMAGQGDGVSRSLQCAFTSNSIRFYIQRREQFQDARDLDSTAKLSDRGYSLLADKGITDIYSLVKISNSYPLYKQHFAVGDLVTLEWADYGVQSSVRIHETEVTVQAGQIEQVKITFGKATPKLSNALKTTIIQSSSRS